MSGRSFVVAMAGRPVSKASITGLKWLHRTDAVQMGSEYVLLRPHINRHYTRGPPNVMVRADRRMTSDGRRAARGTVIQEPAAWIGADIQNDRTWIHQLDARALAE